MGSNTIKVATYSVGALLREQFLVPLVEAGASSAETRDVRGEIASIKERVTFGDVKIYSELFGCWIEVVDHV